MIYPAARILPSDPGARYVLHDPDGVTVLTVDCNWMITARWGSSLTSWSAAPAQGSRITVLGYEMTPDNILRITISGGRPGTIERVRYTVTTDRYAKATDNVLVRVVAR